MDTSKEYIKMCDCDEIREYFDKHYPVVHFKKFGGDIENPWLLLLPQKVCVDEFGNFWFIGGKRNIPLPRQDQIQEMIGIDSGESFAIEFIDKIVIPRLANIGNVDNVIVDYGLDFRFVKMKSMEQLWLAFYMHEKHGKIWSEGKWVKK